MNLFSTRERLSDCMLAISRHTMSHATPAVNLSDPIPFFRAHESMPELCDNDFCSAANLRHMEKVCTGAGGGPQGHRKEGDWFSETPRRLFQKSMPAICCHGVRLCLGSERAFSWGCQYDSAQPVRLCRSVSLSVCCQGVALIHLAMQQGSVVAKTIAMSHVMPCLCLQ